MSLNKDVSQKQKLTEQFQNICSPRQRAKRRDGLSIEQSYSSEKLSIDNLPRENQPVVLGENSLKFGMIRSQLHILET